MPPFTDISAHADAMFAVSSVRIELATTGALLPEAAHFFHVPTVRSRHVSHRVSCGRHLVPVARAVLRAQRPADIVLSV
eukprot:54935-Eustigmatos_ZCMA.PRE.1